MTCQFLFLSMAPRSRALIDVWFMGKISRPSSLRGMKRIF